MLELKKTRGMIEVVDVQPQFICRCTCTNAPGFGIDIAGAQSAGQIGHHWIFSEPGLDIV